MDPRLVSLVPEAECLPWLITLAYNVHEHAAQEESR